MKMPDRLQALRSQWGVYFLVLATLGVFVLVFLTTTWPQPWNLFAAQVLLREAAPAPWASPPPAASLTGCYTLVFSECVLGSREAPCLAWVPRDIELTMERRERHGIEAFVVRTTGEAVQRMSSWFLTRHGTLSVGFSDGFSGVNLELGPRVEGLGGLAHTWTDSMSTSQWAKVQAKRRQCSGAGT